MQDRWRASITELMVVSRTTRWCRDHKAIAIMLKKESTRYSSIITNFQKRRELSFCEAVVSTQGAILEPTFRVICLWNI